jgi:hypothetical protein
MGEIIVIRETLLGMQICTTIPPEQKDTINAKLVELGLNVSGTTHGWTLEEDIPAIPCEDYPNRWHYVCVC